MLTINRETLPVLFKAVLARAVTASAADGGLDVSTLDATEAYVAGLCYAFELADLVVDSERGRSFIVICDEGRNILKRLEAGEEFDELMHLPVRRMP